VLVIPPFAEEMNKCRRMVTEVALGLADQGLGTVVPDLYGTGDSGGDFVDATWAGWLEDLGVAADWSGQQGAPVTGILATRLGAALAVGAMSAGSLPTVRGSVLWQPVLDGGRHVAQFLRLRIAASLTDDRRETLADLRAHLASGHSIEVAGYPLSSRLAAELETVRAPDSLPAGLGDMAWIELVREAGAGLASPSEQLLQRCAQAGRAVRAHVFVGEPFWASTEIVTNAEVVAATVEHLADLGPSTGEPHD